MRRRTFLGGLAAVAASAAGVKAAPCAPPQAPVPLEPPPPAPLPPGSIVTDGGWCAPKGTYDLFSQYWGPEDMMDALPEVRVHRGGIQYPAGRAE